tara:strand:- start:6262 stop:6483 length:222 start_codon:yes stop_codon:yes gene_type:complete
MKFNIEENDILDMSIRIMDKLSKMKILNKKQSSDLDFSIQDAITDEIKVVLQRVSLAKQIDNNSMSMGEFDNE